VRDHLLRDYLQGQQALADLGELVSGPDPISTGEFRRAGWAVLACDNAWLRISVGDEINAYYRPVRQSDAGRPRPAGTRFFVVSDLGEAVREMRLRTGSRAPLGFLRPARHLPRVRLYDSALWAWRDASDDALPCDGDMIPEANLPSAIVALLQAVLTVRSRDA
jgi:hypothetical protein